MNISEYGTVNTIQDNIFTAGGTLPLDSPTYVKRPADDELFYLLQGGQFCYVLTPRQMGKSSLMIRTVQRLKEANSFPVVVDLTTIGTSSTVDQWYLGFLKHFKDQLGLTVNLDAWWQSHVGLAPVQRLTDFLQEEVLAGADGQVVVFVDEIDSTLSLDFSDDFFAAIRYIFNARAEVPIFERITFALLGAATPADLIKDSTHTPFNIGQQINLREFSKEDAYPLRQALIHVHPGRGATMFDRIFYWTSGHPYLTQRLCAAVSDKRHIEWPDAKIDELVETLFFSEYSRHETNLQFIRDYIDHSSYKKELLDIYGQVYRGRSIVDDEQSMVQSQLKLVGLVYAQQEAEGGRLSTRRILRIRNQIYRHVFDKKWLKANTPINWARRFLIGGLLIALLFAGIAYLLQQQNQVLTPVQIAENAETDFRRSSNSVVRLENLGMLFALGESPYENRAQSLFMTLPFEDKKLLFSEETVGLDESVRLVAVGTYSTLSNNENNDELLREMQQALEWSNDPQSRALASEIESILAGRDFLVIEEFVQARDSYQDAILRNESNDTVSPNPYSFFERGLAHAGMSDYEAAFTDFQMAYDLVEEEDRKAWEIEIQDAIESDPQLHTSLIFDFGDTYPEMAAFVSPLAPTPTSALTDTPVPTATWTLIATLTSTPTITTSPTPTETREPTMTPTAVPSPTPTPTKTPRPDGVSSGSGLPFGFETFGSWRIGDQPNGTFTQSTTQVHSGSASGRLDYDFSFPENDFVVFQQFNNIGGTPNSFQAWVYGDGSGHYLNVWILDNEGERWHVPLGRITHSGWKQMRGYIVVGQPWPWGKWGNGNDQIDYPIRFYALVLDDYPDNYTGEGTVYIDDLTVSTEANPPTPIPTAELP